MLRLNLWNQPGRLYLAQMKKLWHNFCSHWWFIEFTKHISILIITVLLKIRKFFPRKINLLWLLNHSDKNVYQDSEDDIFARQVERYKKQLQERKKTREILNNCGLRQDWLKNKTGKTELERRVLKRILLKGKPEITIKKVCYLTL